MSIYKNSGYNKSLQHYLKTERYISPATKAKSRKEALTQVKANAPKMRTNVGQGRSHFSMKKYNH